MSDLNPAEHDIHVPRGPAGTGTDAYRQNSEFMDFLLETLPAARAYHMMVDSWTASASLMMPAAWVQAQAGMMRHAINSMGGLHAREQLEEFILNNPIVTPFLNDRAMAHRMWKAGEASPEKDALVAKNNHLYTHNRDGSLNRIRSTDILPNFEKGKNWPQLILTANHAMSAESNDLSGIMKSITALVGHAIEPRLELQAHPNKFSAEGKTIMPAALHTEDNAMKNGAALLYRYNYLRENQSLAARIRIPPYPAGCEISAKEWALQAPSPAAFRLAKLMLKLMVENPDAIDVDQGCTVEELVEKGKRPAAPLVLRDDAADIAAHISLIGYSKAANTVNDAVRILAYELTSRAPDNTPLFSQRVEEGLKPIATPHDARFIISQLATIGIGGGEVPLTPEENAFGMANHRLRVNSKHDWKSLHFLYAEKNKTDYVSHNDRPYIVNGSSHHMGHDPVDALGYEPANGDTTPSRRDEPGFNLENGYVLADEGALERIALLLQPKFAMMKKTEKGAWR